MNILIGAIEPKAFVPLSKILEDIEIGSCADIDDQINLIFLRKAELAAVTKNLLAQISKNIFMAQRTSLSCQTLCFQNYLYGRIDNFSENDVLEGVLIELAISSLLILEKYKKLFGRESVLEKASSRVFLVDDLPRLLVAVVNLASHIGDQALAKAAVGARVKYKKRLGI